MSELMQAENSRKRADTLLDAVAEGFGRLKVLGIKGVPAAATAPGKASPLKAAVMAWVAALTRVGLLDSDAGRVREAFADLAPRLEEMPSVRALRDWLPPRPRPMLPEAVRAKIDALADVAVDELERAYVDPGCNCTQMPPADVIEARRAAAPDCWRRLINGQATG